MRTPFLPAFPTCARLALALCLALSLGSCKTLHKPDPVSIAKEQLDRGDLEGGFNTLESAMHAQRNELEIANFYRAQIVKHDKEDRSIAFFKKLLEEPEPPDELYYNLAFAYIDKIPRVGPMGAGFLSKRSIGQFKAVYEKRNDDWVANYGIGMNYLHWPDYFKKTEGALGYFEKCLALQQGQRLEPKYLLTYLRMGDALVRSGEVDRAYQVWQQGIALFPGHPDLVDRLHTPKDKIADTIRDLYNPNNSIGAINTDISILWARTVPASVVPLHRTDAKTAGVGGQLQSASAGPEAAQADLFAWFTRNLPYLSDKRSYAKVDMSPLGVRPNEAMNDRVGAIAHGMIAGFLAELQGDEAAALKSKDRDEGPFTRPFFHEGLGMGYAASVSIDDVSELARMVAAMNDIDPNFSRLHLAGAGMWFGLEGARDVQQIAAAFRQLGPFGEAYAYEGYGFARTLFYFKTNPQVIQLGAQLRPEAADNFYHGVGRAIWILIGPDATRRAQMLQQVPEQYRTHAQSGYGMGIAFTKIDDPAFVFSVTAAPGTGTGTELDPSDYLTGVTMGYSIRELGDPQYVRSLESRASSRDRCRMERLIEIGQGALQEAEHKGGDLHVNWRNEIRRRINSAGGAAGAVKECV
jgi:tetratricopeptide (TPR) repeat protein